MMGNRTILSQARLVRVDFYVDLPFTLDQVKNQLYCKYKKTDWNIGKKGEARTFYLGSPSSAELIRIYDRNQRIELQSRRSRSNSGPRLRGDDSTPRPLHLTRIEVSWQTAAAITAKFAQEGLPNQLGSLRAYIATFTPFARHGDASSHYEDIIEIKSPFKHTAMYRVRELVHPEHYLTSVLTPENLTLIQELQDARNHLQLLSMNAYMNRAFVSRGSRTRQVLHQRVIRFEKQNDPEIDPSLTFLLASQAFLGPAIHHGLLNWTR